MKLLRNGKRRPSQARQKSSFVDPLTTLSILAASFSSASAQFESDVCACSPAVYELTFDFGLTCPTTNVFNDGGVANQFCQVSPFGDATENITDLIPVEVNYVYIQELGQSFDVIVQNNATGPFFDGDSFSFESIVSGSQGDTGIPRALQVNIFGFNAMGQSIVNFYAISFTNDCNSFPVITEGTSFGWTVFTQLEDPSNQLCPAAPLESPSPTSTPSEAPISTPDPTAAPSGLPTTIPPVVEPTEAPVAASTDEPTDEPTKAPVAASTDAPTEAPVVLLTDAPTEAPVVLLTDEPTEAPVVELTDAPTETPVVELTDAPTETPVVELTDAPTEAPVVLLTDEPTEAPVVELTDAPTEAPVVELTDAPTEAPVQAPATMPPFPTIPIMSMSMSMSMDFEFDLMDLSLEALLKDMTEFGRPESAENQLGSTSSYPKLKGKRKKKTPPKPSEVDTPKGQKLTTIEAQTEYSKKSEKKGDKAMKGTKSSKKNMGGNKSMKKSNEKNSAADVKGPIFMPGGGIIEEESASTSKKSGKKGGVKGGKGSKGGNRRLRIPTHHA